MVEQIAVNDKVVGSNPTCGAYKIIAPLAGAFDQEKAAELLGKTQLKEFAKAYKKSLDYFIKK